MKKIFTILLSFIFLVSAMGTTINAHYCGEKLQSISLLKTSCCCNNMDGSGCCKNTTTYIKVKDNFSASSQTKLVIPYAILQPLNEINFSTPLFPSFIFSTSAFKIPNTADRTIVFRSILI